MIECGFPGHRLGIDHDEFVPACDGLPVPEMAGLADPCGPVNDIHRQSLKPRAQPRRAFIISLGHLRADGERYKKQAQKQSHLPENLLMNHRVSPQGTHASGVPR